MNYILFTLVILRNVNVVATMFGLSTRTAGRVFVTWLGLLWSAHFPLIRMPTWAEVADGYPASVRE